MPGLPGLDLSGLAWITDIASKSQEMPLSHKQSVKANNLYISIKVSYAKHNAEAH